MFRHDFLPISTLSDVCIPMFLAQYPRLPFCGFIYIHLLHLWCELSLVVGFLCCGEWDVTRRRMRVPPIVSNQSTHHTTLLPNTHVRCPAIFFRLCPRKVAPEQKKIFPVVPHVIYLCRQQSCEKRRHSSQIVSMCFIKFAKK